MSETRSLVQIEANKIDMEMHRLADRLEQFGSTLRSSGDRESVEYIAGAIRHRRSTVRQMMHPRDRAATE